MNSEKGPKAFSLSAFRIHNFLGSPPANSPRHRPVPRLGERLDLRLREAGEYDPELRELKNVQGLLLRRAQAGLPSLIALNHS